MRTERGEDTRVDAHLVYSCNANGTQFKSSSLSVIGPRSASQIVRQYPAGTTVQVFFDPQNPGSAVLERSGRLHIVVLIFSLVNFVIAFAFLARR